MNLDIYTNKIRYVARTLINDYKEEHTVLCGINGPYDDPETEVRNLSHLIIITALEIKIFHQLEYKSLLEMMGENLINLKNHNGLFKMRIKDGKDECNGVIGHAWVNEALIYLYTILGEKKYLDLAFDISKKHLFQSELGLWFRPAEEKERSTIDYTMNHQVWYAASLFELNRILQDASFENELNIFMDNLTKNMEIAKSGRISHNIYRRLDIKASAKQLLKKNIIRTNEKFNKPSFAYKEEGYHLFNIMALARVYAICPDKAFFREEKFYNALDFLNSSQFFKGLINKNINLDSSLKNMINDEAEKEINIYGYPYNVPGFEILYIAKIFEKKISEKVVQKCIDQQFALTFDEKKKMFGQRCHDKNTINYRIYEYYRFLEII